MLNVDLFFTAALRDSADVIEVTEGRIFDPARPLLDEEEDKIPYLIVTYDGGGSSGISKDNVIDDLDGATVSIIAVANDREGLADLTETVSEAIEAAFEDAETADFYERHDLGFYISGCTPSAGPVMMDEEKPCCYQKITYQCDTQKP